MSSSSASSDSSSFPPPFSSAYRNQVLTHAYRAANTPQLQQQLVADLAIQYQWKTDDLSGFLAACSNLLSSSVSLLAFLNKSPLLIGTITKLRFDYDTASLSALCNEIILYYESVISSIVCSPVAALNFHSSFHALQQADRVLDPLNNQITFLAHVSSDKHTRDVANTLTKQLAEYEVRVSMNIDLYRQLQAVGERELPALTGEAKRLVEFTLRDYRRNGLALHDDKRQRVEAIKKEMSNLSIEFQKNLGEEKTTFEFTADELIGVPQDDMERFEKKGDKYVVSLKYTDYFSVMENCSVDATRAKLEFAFTSRCADSNTKILERLVKLRDEQAKLLGYATHAHYVLETRMAKSPESVATFLSDLSKKLNPLQDRDIDYLLELKRQEKLSKNEEFDGVIRAYDSRYYDHRSEQMKFQIDHELIRQYFPMNTVFAGMFDIYQRVLGYTFTKVAHPSEGSTWHPDVELYTCADTATGQLVGYFYLDLFPREGKYGHAAVFGLKPGCTDSNGARDYPVAGMVTNFTKPTSEKPSLMKHNEVVTFFHEFGHVMHQLSSSVKYARFAGTNVERDFVEAPSQMLENWCWHAEPLRLMSGHYQTGEKLPQHIIDKLILSKTNNSGIFNKRQITLASYDQFIHSRPDADICQAWHDIVAQHSKILPTPGTCFPASFGHIAGGYDSQYYGYLWSEVFSADMFASRFEREGLLNSATGLDYRRKVISKGGSQDAMELIVDFLGRQPNQEAFLKSKGL